LTGSVTHAAPFVGAMIASRWLAAIVSSIDARATAFAAVRASEQAGSARPPVAWASSKIREFHGPSRSGWAALKSMRSWSVFGYAGPVCVPR